MAQFAFAEVSLQAHLQRGNISVADASSIARQIGELLAQVHSAGRTHGNLTIASVLLRRDSSGLRVTIDGSGDHGNVEYLAPERRTGGQPSVASDIYSFGRILEHIRIATAED